MYFTIDKNICCKPSIAKYGFSKSLAVVALWGFYMHRFELERNSREHSILTVLFAVVVWR